MAKDTVVVDGVVFTVHPKTVTIKDAEGKDKKITIGYSHLPNGLSGVKTEDDAMLWLNDLVEKGVLTYKQVVTSLYDLVLQQHQKILRQYTEATTGGAKFNLDEAMAKWGAEALADGNRGWNAIRAFVEEKWAESVKNNTNVWNEKEHQLYPKDVR